MVRREEEVLGPEVVDEFEDVAPLPGDDLMLASVRSKTLTWIRWLVFGKKVSTSSERKSLGGPDGGLGTRARRRPCRGR